MSNSIETTLTEAKIDYQVKNEGKHFIITPKGASTKSDMIDFWPSTGRWTVRKTKESHYGWFSLLTYLGAL